MGCYRHARLDERCRGRTRASSSNDGVGWVNCSTCVGLAELIPITYHRLACAIEDAGWQIRDCLGWLYGSGFPKSLDVSKAIDKAAGAEREKVPTTGSLHKTRNLNDDGWSKIGSMRLSITQQT